MNLSSFHSAAEKRPTPGQAGFTMIEIAICLAIIGIALVAIIGVLPLGMHTQRENREETIINQDASILLEAIRNGSLAQDDLTNYVVWITNYCVYFSANPTVSPLPSPINKYYYGVAGFTNGAQIIQLLSTPQYLTKAPYFQPTKTLYYGGFSNHVVAAIRSMSGYAMEKPPQDNEILQQDTFSYHVYVENASAAVGTNVEQNPQHYDQQMDVNLHELRLKYLYPTLPNGSNGLYALTFRTLVAGRIGLITNEWLQTPAKYPYFYYYQSQSYTNVP
jgi:prepilin-type N-terminal cleavage/methylation domain-containing protein